MMNPFLQVALGGAAGSVARYGVNRAALAAFGPGFPAATLAVNILGSFLMGLAAPRAGQLGPLLMTGLLGGFTTFSAFSLDAVTLWTRGQHGAAAAYVAASVALSLGALALGLTLARPA